MSVASLLVFWYVLDNCLKTKTDRYVFISDLRNREDHYVLFSLIFCVIQVTDLHYVKIHIGDMNTTEYRFITLWQTDYFGRTEELKNITLACDIC